ncbi:SDR family NAD(P)-dependent oxidoreductase [Frankia sp. AiPs1]|uniref:SDR family NAD(P)-dependent oxidoreductase n=1 Tax=Frankia sp. AiPs1 TaxID=573493 RepID=UPI002044753E|nr:SDR family NAD(P)-dependent oxidoreductase [Frankia sp. AiPs1]MCM3921762.1 SDR family NAD(P)-dependent oxidoreductase [Frankia sp. AiPs1]
MSALPGPTVLVIGAGPGLGLSVGRRFGQEGFRVALVSRNGARHDQYVSSLAELGITARAFAADILRPDPARRALDAVTEAFASVDVVYYGPGAADPAVPPESIAATTRADAERAMSITFGAVQVVNHVLPAMIGRGRGGLLFAGGLSAVTPMPALGSLALTAAAVRAYALSLNVALAGQGVYAGTLTIGGVVERGDIYRQVVSDPSRYGPVEGHTLDPDTLADAAWRMYSIRDRAESVFSALDGIPAGG